MDNDQSTLTAGESSSSSSSVQNSQEPDEEEEEEAKEVDPLIVGSLDNVYKDEPGAEMKEDPFKKVPIMDDHEKPSSMMEMEKSVDAMVALIEHPPDSPIPEDATSLDRQLRHPISNNQNIISPEHLPNLLGAMEGIGEGGPLSGGAADTTTDGGIPLDLAVGAQRPVDLLEEADVSSGGGSSSSSDTMSSQPVDLTKGLGMPLMSSS